MNWLRYIPIFLFLLSCSSSTKDTTSIKLYLQAEPISFDPRIGGDRRSQVVLRHLFEGLTRIGAQGTAELALAKACSISSKGTIYTFSLQKTYWSNGLPVTAHDFEFAWKTVIDPSFGSAYSHVFAVIKNVAQSRAHKCSLNEIGIQAIDDYTLEVVLEHPCPYFLELIANPLFSPAYSAYVTKDWNSKTYPEYVSNGPYILKEHVVKSHILLEKNPFYHRENLPKTASLHFAIIDNPFTAELLLDKGDLDWYGDPCGLTPIETIHALGTRLQTKPISAIYWLLCNTKEYHLSSPKIRRAIACAIDRNVLCQFLKGGEIPAHSIIPQQRPSFHFCDGQPSVAKELFQEGLAELKLTQKMFPPVDLSYWSEPACKAIAEILKEQIEQTLGIRVTLHGHDWATQMNNLSSGNFAITTSAWFPLAQDPLLSLNYFKNGGATSTHWQNDTYTQLLDKAEAAEIQEERHSCLEQAERIIMQEMPAIPLYYIAYKFLKNPKLHGEIISSTGAVDFLYLEKSNN